MGMQDHGEGNHQVVRVVLPEPTAYVAYPSRTPWNSAEPFTRTCPAGSCTSARTFTGMSTVSVRCDPVRRQVTPTSPRCVGTLPDAEVSPDAGGRTSTCAAPGAVTDTPSSVR